LHIFWGLSLALSRTTRVWGGSSGGGSSSNEKCFGGMGGGSSSSPRSVAALWVTVIGRKPVAAYQRYMREALAMKKKIV